MLPPQGKALLLEVVAALRKLEQPVALQAPPQPLVGRVPLLLLPLPGYPLKAAQVGF